MRWQLFSIQILLPFQIFKPLPSCNISILQTSGLGSSAYFFPALFISGTHKVPGFKFKGG